jgi:hypothetical protein
MEIVRGRPANDVGNRVFNVNTLLCSQPSHVTDSRCEKYIPIDIGVREKKMKKAIVALLVGISMLMMVGVSVAAPSASDFDGMWFNVNSLTGGITQVEIDTSGATDQGEGVSIHAWGSCTPTDCDWGAVPALAYAPDVSTNVFDTTVAFTAIFDSGFSQTILVIHPAPNDQLQVEQLTQFLDGSGRSNYANVEYFHREGSEETCIDFTAEPLGFGPNPATYQDVSFLVMDHTGSPMADTEIRNDGGVYVGLNVGFSLEITLPAAYQEVTLTLVHFARPAEAVAYNGSTIITSATMASRQGTPETLTLSAASPEIDRVVVTPPSDETNLLKLCYSNPGKSGD